MEPRTVDSAAPAKSDSVPPQPTSGGCFRPFCLALALILLVTVTVIGGALVLVVRQVVPPEAVTELITALTGHEAQITVKATTILDRIQAMSQLTTTRYNYSSLVTSERDLPDVLKALYGDKEVLIAVGYINAGIDLQKITPDDVVQSGTTLTIKLPPPHLQDCFLDEKASYVASRDTGVFSKPAPNLDQEARRYAVEQFRDMALKANILDDVQGHAQTLIQAFVSTLNVQGVKTVSVITAAPDPNTLPDSCK